jgi:chorismate mutase
MPIVFPPGSDSQRLWAVRGAVQVERNERDAILASTTALMNELMARNGLEPARMVSCIFTCTDDLDAEFPAVAARELGLGEVPLLCNRELDVPGAMERVIRVLVHYYADDSHAPDHTYLGAAQALRADLHSAQ